MRKAPGSEIKAYHTRERISSLLNKRMTAKTKFQRMPKKGKKEEGMKEASRLAGQGAE
jgi:hypothetical protein